LDTSELGSPNLDPWKSLRQGLLTIMLNPKVGVFYITRLPPCIPAGTSVALFSFLLATFHVLLSVVWSAVLITRRFRCGASFTAHASSKDWTGQQVRSSSHWERN